MTEAIHHGLMQTARNRHPELYSLFQTNLRDLAPNSDALTVEKKDQSECFYFLARTVVGQLLSAKAARTIWSRIENVASDKELDLIDLFSEACGTDIRACGLSKNKFRAISGLRAQMLKNKDFAAQILDADYAEIKTRLTALWGFGEWSADMCAISLCGLPDVFPAKDVAIINGLNRLCGSEKAEIAASKYAPYRSYLCKHIWLGFNTGYI